MISYLRILLLNTLLLSGCAFHYVPEIHQGNVVSQDRFEMVEVGMTKRQVIAVLGTPLIQDTFNSNQYHYPYKYEDQNTYVAVIFDVNETVIAIQGTPSHPHEDHINEMILVPDKEVNMLDFLWKS